MSYKSVFLSFVVLLFVFSCVSQNLEPKEKISQQSQAGKTKLEKNQQLGPVGEKRKDYVPGEILVKFNEGTDNEAIKSIERELHLETIQIFQKPNLYLMKILDGSSVESIIERLKNFKEVRYSEPNYLRSIY